MGMFMFEVAFKPFFKKLFRTGGLVQILDFYIRKSLYIQGIAAQSLYYIEG